MTSLAQTILMEMDDLIRTIQIQTPWIEYDEAKKIATARLKERYGDEDNNNPQN